MMDEYRMDTAWSHYMAGRHDAAIDLLKGLLAENPNEALAHGLLAANLLEKARIYAAEYELKIALQLDPRQPFFFWLQARILLLRNKPKQALATCDEALTLDPDFYNAHLLKSQAFMLLGRRRQALESIDAAAALQPDKIAILLAYADYHLDTGDRRKAATFTLEALGQDAQNEHANLLMGKIQLVDGNIEEAEYHAKFVILNNPQSESGLRLLGDIKARKNWFLGVWWRLNARLSGMSDLKQTTWLIGAYVFFNLLAQGVRDLGYPGASAAVAYFWLAFAVYTWVALPMYQRALKAELQKFAFNRDF